MIGWSAVSLFAYLAGAFWLYVDRVFRTQTPVARDAGLAIVPQYLLFVPVIWLIVTYCAMFVIARLTRAR